MRHKLLSIITLTILCPILGYGQVTIGSKKVPVHGALLDVNDANASATAGGITTTKGLGIPRVKLTDQSNLYPMFETVPGNGTANEDYNDVGKKQVEDERHIGLVVYNYDECGLQGKGLYVWEEDGWSKLDLNKTSIGLNLSSSNLMLWNGIPHKLDIAWNPSTLAPPTYTSTGLSFTLAPNPLITSPTEAVLSVEEMTEQELALNPFKRKEGTLTFTLLGSPCAVGGAPQVQTLTAVQVSKALLVNGSSKPNAIRIDENNKEHNITVQSNARWMMQRILPSAVSGANVGVPLGTDDNSGDESKAEKVQLKLKSRHGYQVPRINYLIFTDRYTPKRFRDVTLLVYQCAGDKDMSLFAYKDLWEDMYGLYAGNEPDSNGNEALNTNKVQWHYDQNKKDNKGNNAGNIFFSAMFGNRRWMTTNLAATVYDTDVLPCPSPIVASWPEYAWVVVDKNPIRWRYIESYEWDATEDRYYKASPREGIFYSELMATAEHESTNQGICPNGWRLPSKTDWEDLFAEVKTNYAKYSLLDVAPDNTNYARALANTCMGYYRAAAKRNLPGKSRDFLNGGFDIIFPGWGTKEYEINSTGTIGFFTSTQARSFQGSQDYPGGFNYRANIGHGYRWDDPLYDAGISDPGNDAISLDKHMLSVRCIKND